MKYFNTKGQAAQRSTRQFSVAIWLVFCCVGTVWAQTTAFTYHGKLTDAGNPANGNYDLQFKLFDTVTVGTGVQQGATLARTTIAASAGVFTVTLDFGGNVFDGSARHLEISVRPAGNANPYTALAPRQPVTSTPYAIRSLTAGNAIQLGGVDATRFVQSDMGGNVSVAGDLSVTGTLSLDIINAQTQYNLGGNRILGNAGNSNLFVGTGAGASNSASFNTFVGNLAGNANTTGDANAYFGSSTGQQNTTGRENAFFGVTTGASNTMGVANSFFGSQAGLFNTGGSFNSIFGRFAGGNNNASDNAFFGAGAGEQNTTGTNNSFFGTSTGSATITGSNNSFFGRNTGLANTLGSNNTLLGNLTNVGANNLTNANAIGANALVSTSNSLVLGSINGVNSATASTNVGIGTTAPLARFHVVGSSWFQGDTTPLPNTAGKGIIIGFAGEQGYISAFDYGTFTPKNLLLNLGGGNVGIGTTTPTDAKLQVIASVNGTAVYGVSTANGSGIVGETDSGIAIAGFSNSSAGKAGYFVGDVQIFGSLLLSSLGTGGNQPLCRQNPGGLLATCSSSLRYKTVLQTFDGGLNVVRRLRPLTFVWKADKTLDVGFGAEDVAEIEPLLITRNVKGEVEGVKYDRLSVVFVNAFKEQQAQLEQQQQQIKQQQQQIDGLRKLLCQIQPQAAICQ